MKTTLISASAILATLAAGAPLFANAEEQPRTSPAAAAAAAPATTTGILTKTFSVIVNENGTLAVGPSGATSSSIGSGIYQVIFPSAVNACVYAATIGDAGADVPAAGLVNVTRRGGNINGIFVQTFNPNGARTNHPFHLMVQS